MTREEAREWIIHLIDTMKKETHGSFSDPEYKDEVYEALDMAIKALEQESVLDKIRAEILEISSYEGFELGGVKDGYRIAMVNVLNIIDKYKVESEE